VFAIFGLYGLSLTLIKSPLPHIFFFTPQTDFFGPFSTNCPLNKLYFLFVMGIADMPCSGYIRDQGETIDAQHSAASSSVFLLSTFSPGLKHAAAKKSDQTGAHDGIVPSSGSTTTIQISTKKPKKPKKPRRPTPKTSTVPRPRSGWCGFSDFAGGLPGPLGTILGR
jgi:hypothetical protein